VIRENLEPGRIRLVVSDVDGTLVDQQKRVTPRARAAIAALNDDGVQLVLASSRPPRGLEALHRELELTSPMVAFNGGLVVTPDGRPLAELSLPMATGAQSVTLLRRSGAGVWAFTGRDWFVEDPSGPRVTREATVLGFGPTVVDDVLLVAGATKLVGVSYDDAVLRACERALAADLGHRISVARGHACYVDVTHPSATKGNAVRLLSETLGIPPEAILSIGDMETDATMFCQSGIAIAMANAPPKVQASAHFVTASNDDDGFARAIERWVLGRSG